MPWARCALILELVMISGMESDAMGSRQRFDSVGMGRREGRDELSRVERMARCRQRGPTSLRPTLPHWATDLVSLHGLSRRSKAESNPFISLGVSAPSMRKQESPLLQVRDFSISPHFSGGDIKYLTSAEENAVSLLACPLQEAATQKSPSSS